MGKTGPLTAEDQALLDEGWDEMGQSIAAMVVSGTRNSKWAWELLGPLGLYKRWMLDAWIERYRQEHPEIDSPPKGRRRGGVRSVPAHKQSKFTKREQIQEALKMLNDQNAR